MLTVRLATAKDADAASDVLAASFADYAWTNWTVDARDRHDRIAALQRLAFTELTLPYGEAWVALHEDRIVSAAMWMRPDLAVPDHVWAAMEPRVAELEGDRHAASVAAEAFLAPHRPTSSHWYLGAVGTLPSHQRRGVGRAVLQPVLTRATTACLETCGAANVAFYETLGFTTTAEVALPDAAPTVVLMTAAKSSEENCRSGAIFV